MDAPTSNYLDHPNPFNLPAPSAWWLTLLRGYDAMLVVFPSKKDYAYRLCRRVAREKRLGMNPLITHGHPDTIVMVQQGLVPVGTLLPWAVRSDKIIRDLQRRDTWTHGATPGNATRLVDDLEYREARRDEKKAAQQVARLDHVSGEAFRSLQFRNGSAVALGHDHNFAIADHNRVSSPRSPRPLAQTRVSLTDLA